MVSTTTAISAAKRVQRVFSSLLFHWAVGSLEEKVKYQVFISKKERRENVLLVKGDENGGASAVVGYFLTVNNRDRSVLYGGIG